MNVQEEARRRWDSVAKPLHSLGLLEDLVVRIAGYSAYFVELGRDLQNDIISRNENRL